MSTGSPTAETLRLYAERRLTLDVGPGEVGTTINYRLMVPENPPAGQRFPLVVFLHGAGERGDDNRTQLRYLPEVLARPERRRRYPCFVAAPQCPSGAVWCTPPAQAAELRRLGGATVASSFVETLVHELGAAEAVDESRIYLTGLSMGGFGAWHAAAARPDLFAALAVICGGGNPLTAAKLKSLPIWAVHGALDEIVPVERSTQMVAAVRAAGGNPKYTELPTVGHDSWTPAYEPAFGLLDWMFEQRR